MLYVQKIVYEQMTSSELYVTILKYENFVFNWEHWGDTCGLLGIPIRTFTEQHTNGLSQNLYVVYQVPSLP